MKYDYIVVGAGAAGAVVASRLSEDRHRNVMLIEAGPDYPTLEEMPEVVRAGYAGYAPAYDNWMDERHIRRLTGKATPGTETVPFVGKVAGGGSAVNGAMFIRGVPEDYDLWAAAGNDLWSFAHCLPYFRKLETDLDFGGNDFHGSNGPIIVRRFKPAEWLPIRKRFYNACRAAGFPDCPDFNHPAGNPASVRCRSTIPTRFAGAPRSAYLNPARHRLNLTIRPRCQVRRVIFDGDRATGARS